MNAMLARLVLSILLLVEAPVYAEDVDTPPVPEPAGPGVTLRDAAAERGVAWPPPRFWISIDKSDHRLVAWSGDTWRFMEIGRHIGEIWRDIWSPCRYR